MGTGRQPPAYRRLGLQTLRIRLRAEKARRLGCELPGVNTRPGTQSQLHLEREGFRLVYTKTLWRPV